MICALTGHRVLGKEYDSDALYDDLESLVNEGYDLFRCGMARGFDWEALKLLIALKKKYRFQIEACIPYAGHEESFPVKERKNYLDYLSWCDKIHVLYERYCDGCFLARDRYMVDDADLVFAYCKRERGGTAYTVNYARKKEVPIRFFGTHEEANR